MIIDLEKRHEAMQSHCCSRSSFPYLRLREIMVQLYNATPSPDRPTRGILPDGVEEYLLDALRYTGEAGANSFYQTIQECSFELAPLPDLGLIMGEFNYDES